MVLPSKMHPCEVYVNMTILHLHSALMELWLLFQYVHPEFYYILPCLPWTCELFEVWEYV